MSENSETELVQCPICKKLFTVDGTVPNPDLCDKCWKSLYWGDFAAEPETPQSIARMLQRADKQS